MSGTYADRWIAETWVVIAEGENLLRQLADLPRTDLTDPLLQESARVGAELLRQALARAEES